MNTILRIPKLRSLTQIFSVIFVLAGCAVSPEIESQRADREATIDAILAEPLDGDEFGTVKRCLASREYRSFRALDDRHILFEGRGDDLWINTLRTRCPDLRHGRTLILRPVTAGRICDLDSFQATDFFAWPWYRRWPWQWGGSWGNGMTCSFGKFQPVSEAQVADIEAAIKSQ